MINWVAAKYSLTAWACQHQLLLPRLKYERNYKHNNYPPNFWTRLVMTDL